MERIIKSRCREKIKTESYFPLTRTVHPERERGTIERFAFTVLIYSIEVKHINTECIRIWQGLFIIYPTLFFSRQPSE